MSNKINNLYEFGEFCLDTKERVLIRENETIILAPKVFDTLEVLLKSNGKIVSKDDLMNQIWEDSFVEEGNLTQNIYVLRQTLGKDFIETIPRRGYRFSAGVKAISIDKKNENLASTNGSNEIIVAQRTRTKIVEEEFLDDESSTSDISTISPKSRKPIESKKIYLGFAFGTLTILLVGVLGFWFSNNNSSKAADVAFERTQFESLTDTGDVETVAVSPNNRFAAYTINASENKKILRLKDLKINEDVRVEIPTNINPLFLRFSNDGDFIYFLNRPNKNPFATIYRITRFGGEAKIIANDVSSEFSFSKNGKQIAFIRKNAKTNETSLIVRDLETEKENVVLTKNFPDSFSMLSSPAFSADGGKIYFLTENEGSHRSKISLIDLKTTEVISIETPKWIKHFIQIESTPNEDELIAAARENGKFSQVFKVSIKDGTVARITNDLNNYRKISVSADGKSIATLQKEKSSNLWLVPDGDIERSKQLTKGDFNKIGRNGLEILPDGKILFVSLANGNRDISTLDLSDENKNQLTRDEFDASQNPAISPNGRHIYYESSKNKSKHIKRMEFDGQNQIFITSDENINDTFPAVSPDGNTLYFIRRAEGSSSIMKIDLPEGQPEKLKIPEEIVPDGFLRISPDGRNLAFQQIGKYEDISKNSQEKMKVGIISLDESNFEPKYFQLNSSYPTIRWTSTSDGFDYIENTADLSFIKRLKINGQTETETIFEMKNKQIREFIWMPNGNDLLISDSIDKTDGILITGF